MVVMFPAGIRGVDGPQIYPGLYAVVGRNFGKFLKKFPNLRSSSLHGCCYPFTVYSRYCMRNYWATESFIACFSNLNFLKF